MKPNYKRWLIMGITLFIVAVIIFVAFKVWENSIMPPERVLSPAEYYQQKRAGYSRSKGAIPQDVINSQIEALSNEDPIIRYHAICWFHGIKERAAPAIPAIAKALYDPDEDVAGTAAYALGMLGPLAKDAVPTLIEAFTYNGNSVPVEAEDALRSIGESALPALLDAVASKNEDIRYHAISTLGGMGWGPDPLRDKIFAAILKALDDEYDYVRSAAVKSFALKSKSEIVIPKLITLLSDEDEWVRLAAVDTLSMRHGSKATVALDTFVEMLDIEENDYVKSSVFRAIARLGSAASPAVPHLLAKLDSEDIAHAIRTLCHIGPEPGVLPAMLKTLKDERKKVRFVTADYIHLLGPHPNLIKALIATLNDESNSVRREAIESLGELGPAAEEALPYLREMYERMDDKGLANTILGAINDINETPHAPFASENE